MCQENATYMKVQIHKILVTDTKKKLWHSYYQVWHTPCINAQGLICLSRPYLNPTPSISYKSPLQYPPWDQDKGKKKKKKPCRTLLRPHYLHLDVRFKCWETSIERFSPKSALQNISFGSRKDDCPKAVIRTPGKLPTSPPTRKSPHVNSIL